MFGKLEQAWKVLRERPLLATGLASVSAAAVFGATQWPALLEDTSDLIAASDSLDRDITQWAEVRSVQEATVGLLDASAEYSAEILELSRADGLQSETVLDSLETLRDRFLGTAGTFLGTINGYQLEPASLDTSKSRFAQDLRTTVERLVALDSLVRLRALDNLEAVEAGAGALDAGLLAQAASFRATADDFNNEAYGLAASLQSESDRIGMRSRSLSWRTKVLIIVALYVAIVGWITVWYAIRTLTAAAARSE